MGSVRAILSGVVLLALVGFLYYVQSSVGKPIETGDLAPVSTLGKTPFTSSMECKECHEEIWNEWASSLHAIATTDPIYRTFRNTGYGQGDMMAECDLCHIPTPVFEGELGKFPHTRTHESDPVPGVTCLSCHQMGDRVVGVQGLTGAGKCNPINDARLRESIMCGSCHKNQQLNLVRFHEWEEWQERSVHNADKHCVDCHMLPVERPLVNDGPVRTSHDHKMSVIHNSEFLRSGFDVDLQVIGSQVVMPVSVKDTAHYLPTGYRIRNLRFNLRIDNPEGGEPLWTGQFHAHKKSAWGGEETRLRDREVKIFRFDLPAELNEGVVKLTVDYSIASIFGPPPTPIYEIEQAFPHEPRPLPEEVIPPSVPKKEEVKVEAPDTSLDVGWFGYVFLGVLLLWLLGWGRAGRE